MRAPGSPISPAATLFAWAGAVLFLAALGCFLLFYALVFSQPQPGPASGSAVVWDVALFTVFALHHSVFARERVRALVARHVPTALERSFYVWVASLLLIGVCVLWRPVGGVAWTVSGGIAWILAMVQLAGIWLTLRSAAMIDVFELAGLGPLRRVAAPSEFKTTGPYGLVRHPIYTGWFLIVFPVAVMTGTRLVFAVISSVYLLMAIPFEERSLRSTTAGAYDRYSERVRWRLIPGLY